VKEVSYVDVIVGKGRKIEGASMEREKI